MKHRFEGLQWQRLVSGTMMMLHDTAASAIKVTAVFFIEWVPSLCKGKNLCGPGLSKLQRRHHMRSVHVKRTFTSPRHPTYFPWNPGCFIGILMGSFFHGLINNPYITWVDFHPPFSTATNQSFDNCSSDYIWASPLFLSHPWWLLSTWLPEVSLVEMAGRWGGRWAGFEPILINSELFWAPINGQKYIGNLGFFTPK